LTRSNVKKALLEDREQNLNLELKNKIKVNEVDTTHVTTQVPAEAMDEVYNQFMTAAKANQVESFNVKFTQESVLLSLLVNLLPIAILVILLLLFMSQMQGGGSGCSTSASPRPR
jgi:cell division protease FtsH